MSKEKTADEMFEDLGYEKISKSFLNYIEYTKKENEDIDWVISFEGISKTVMCAIYETGDIRAGGLAIGMQELQAINKKVEELRMELSKEEQEAIENIKNELNTNEFMPRLVFNVQDIETILNLISKLQKENEKQEKVIDEMASRIEILDDDFGAFKEGIKQYYYRKVEEDEKEKI